MHCYWSPWIPPSPELIFIPSCPAHNYILPITVTGRLLELIMADQLRSQVDSWNSLMSLYCLIALVSLTRCYMCFSDYSIRRIHQQHSVSWSYGFILTMDIGSLRVFTGSVSMEACPSHHNCKWISSNWPKSQESLSCGDEIGSLLMFVV